MKKHRIPYKFIVAIFYRSTALTSALVIFLISSYLYGPEGRGAISFLTALYAVLGLLLSFGVGRAVYQRTTNNPETADDLYISTIRFINILSVLVAVVSSALFLFYIVTNHGSMKSDFLNFILFLGYFPYAVWQYISNFFFTASRKTELHDKITIATRCGQITILLITILCKLEINSFIFLYGATSYLVYFVESKALLYTAKTKDSWMTSLRKLYALKNELKWPYIDSLSQMLAPLAIFIMGLLITKEDLGHYNFTLQIISTLYFPLWLLSIKIQEQLSDGTSNIRSTIIKGGFISIIPISLVLIALALTIPPILPHVGLSKFNASMSLLKALLMTVPLVGAYYVFLAIWVSTHRPKFSSLLTIISGLINILCILLLAKKIGPWAGVVGTYCCYTVSLIGNSIYAKKIWTTLQNGNLE